MTADATVVHTGGLVTTSIADWSADLVAAAKRGHRVAVILPARNEAATVGEIVASIVAHHGAGGAPLVDDIVVVDSGSIDDTAVVAATAGARIVTSSRPGKGEAMWHGLAATDADIVAFIDADLEQFDERYVPALVGPLVCDPQLDFVKGCYDRQVDELTMRGGGRVTELMARPILSAFWPELAAVSQPLSGEYAARRSLLERLPFRCGYGVDIGLLIDAYIDSGIGALAQVDLYHRQHRHSDLASLGRMSAEILHTALDRLAIEGRISRDLEVSSAIAQPHRLAGEPVLVSYGIDRAECPPLQISRSASRGPIPQVCVKPRRSSPWC
jgi:glucosyl-3-phosphoglycerate synthase